MPKFAANLTMMFNEYAFEDRFAAAAAAGFEGVEFLFPYAFDPQVLADKLNGAGLQQALFNMPPGDWEAGERGMAAIPARRGEFRENIDIALEYATALDCPTLHAMSGLIDENVDRDTALGCCIENLQYAADKCAEQGINVVIEPLNGRDVPGYFLKNTDQARKIIELAERPNLALQLDFYHLQITEGDLEIRCRALADITGHIQIASVPARHEPDTGEINYAHIFNVIDRSGYEGWVGCEYNPANGTAAGLGWFDAYRKGQA